MTLRVIVNEFELCRGAYLRITLESIASRTRIEAELQLLLIVPQVEQSAMMLYENVRANKNLQREPRYDSELVPQ